MRTQAIPFESWHSLELRPDKRHSMQLEPFCEHCNKRISSHFVIGVFCSRSRNGPFIYEHFVDLHPECVEPWKLGTVREALTA